MTRILLTDAEGLVGLYTLNELLIGLGDTNNSTILAGYHSNTTLQKAITSNEHKDLVQPVLIDWKDPATFVSPLIEVDCILLLTPFTSAKVANVGEWIGAVAEAKQATKDPTVYHPHVVHVGVHCDTTDSRYRVPHESWQLEAEKTLEQATPHVFSSWTHLRINFDGYNGIIKPGEVSYFLPTEERFGWIAREDIAAVAAAVLLKPCEHRKQAYSLAVESLSLSDMAVIASGVCNSKIRARCLTSDDFAKLALSSNANPGGDQGYVDYVKSVQLLFEGLADGKYLSHTAIFPSLFRSICGRDFTSFAQWLLGSPYKAKLSSVAM